MTRSPRSLLIDWLERRAPGVPIEVVETHISIVAFQGDRVFKLKKPVAFAFVDLSTPELREADCLREVELNRRLAADVYLGVDAVTDRDGRVVDHVVEMVRMPPERRLATLARAGSDVVPCLDRVAHVMSRFHATAPTGPIVALSATRDAVAEIWEMAFEQTRQFEGSLLDSRTAQCVATRARRYLAGREPLFAQRIAAGRARDGQGDLLAEDIFCLDDGPRILDCLEFDERLRYGDALADVAFLAMDLERLGRPDLSRQFLDRYSEHAQDDWPSSLEHLYVAYRAHVRAKIACLRDAQGSRTAAVDAAVLLGLAHNHLEAGRVRLVLVGGPPATGKTTVAVALGAELGWPVLRSDVIRKELAGLQPQTRADAPLDQGLYSPSWTDTTYATLIDRAREYVVMGQSVILDASWGHARWLAAAEKLATTTSTDLAAFRCDAPLRVTNARAAARRAEATDASDVGPELARDLTDRFPPWPAAVVLDTSGRPGAATEEALTILRAHCCTTHASSRPGFVPTSRPERRGQHVEPKVPGCPPSKRPS
jgi:aminoglycoside phosphotransferase family enzyme/predicted kinase